MNMTIDTFIEKLQNNEKVFSRTPIYFTMHDLAEAEYSTDDYDDYTTHKFIHIPTNAKIFVTYDLFNDNHRTDVWMILPNSDRAPIWIAADISNKFEKAISIDGDINAFELPFLDF